MSAPINNIDSDIARNKVQDKGFTPRSVTSFLHLVGGNRNVTCYSVNVKESNKLFIVRGDTEEVYDSQEFWDKFSSRALSGPWIELHERE